MKQSPASAKPLSYELRIQPRSNDYYVSEERLDLEPSDSESELYLKTHQGGFYYKPLGQQNLTRADWDINPLETALSQAPRMSREPEDFKKLLASSTHYHVLDVAPTAAVRVPQPMKAAELPGKNGENLVSCLYTIRETDPDCFELIQDTLRAGFPSFERLNFPPVAAGTLAITWKDRTSSDPFYMHQLSEGSLRFLWLAALLYSPGLTAVTMIDEPEVSLHPELLAILVDVFRDAQNRTQLIIATHSDRLIRLLNPDEVVAANVAPDGSTTFQRGSELDLEQWLKEYTLDQLWDMGRIGGRP